MGVVTVLGALNSKSGWVASNDLDPSLPPHPLSLPLYLSSFPHSTSSARCIICPMITSLSLLLTLW